mmetsp:Transcript_35636/g.93535  ORF Transcript_35636/g.93535 Transcript_35636/m.93535 type:complete len:92 (+) Transcript_35636:511-786(+)
MRCGAATRASSGCELSAAEAKASASAHGRALFASNSTVFADRRARSSPRPLAAALEPRSPCACQNERGSPADCADRALILDTADAYGPTSH